MKKKKKIIIAVAILSSLAIAFVGGQSYSKYISEVRGNGTAQIAAWQFKVNGEKEQIQTIELVSTANEETLVAKQIAPGTEGSFDIVIDATGSEVGINYAISFVDGNTKPNNLVFTYNDIEYNTLAQLANTLSGTIKANDAEKTKTFTIKWKWPYQTGKEPSEISNNDVIDTQNAQNITNYTFDVIVSGTQVEPQA